MPEFEFESARIAWEDERDTVALSAWEAWSQNGLGMDYAERELSIKTFRDASESVWQEDMTTAQWRAALIARFE